MNYLAISLHRLGDLLMHGHILQQLNLQHKVKIDLLTHSFFQSVDFLFPFINKKNIFYREACQYSIGEPQFNKSWPFLHIEKLLESINNDDIHLAIDFSQTDTSSRWMTFIKAKNKIGISYNHQLIQKEFTSTEPMIRYLHSNQRSKIHLIDLFKKSLNLKLNQLPKTDDCIKRKKLIIFQTLTSDNKKNWPIENWKNLINKISQRLPDYELIILSSRNEYQFLSSNFFNLPYNCSIEITDLKSTFDLLLQAQLLVTLDTSIKHLATWSKTQIIEIIVGSSSPLETGAYQENAIIVQPNVSCHPCGHSQSCSQKNFICHESIPTLLIELIIYKRLSLSLSKSETQILINHKNQISFVSQNLDGFWCLKPYNQMSEDENARRNQSKLENNNQAY